MQVGVVPCPETAGISFKVCVERAGEQIQLMGDKYMFTHERSLRDIVRLNMNSEPDQLDQPRNIKASARQTLRFHSCCEWSRLD